MIYLAAGTSALERNSMKTLSRKRKTHTNIICVTDVDRDCEDQVSHLTDRSRFPSAKTLKNFTDVPL